MMYSTNDGCGDDGIRGCQACGDGQATDIIEVWHQRFQYAYPSPGDEYFIYTKLGDSVPATTTHPMAIVGT
jgi:hypothetical protein